MLHSAPSRRDITFVHIALVVLEARMTIQASEPKLIFQIDFQSLRSATGDPDTPQMLEMTTDVLNCAHLLLSPYDARVEAKRRCSDADGKGVMALITSITIVVTGAARVARPLAE